MPFKRGSRDEPLESGAAARVAAALRSLDPFSFWIVPTHDPAPGVLFVVGTTGAFLVAACGLSGVVNFGMTGADVGGRAVPVRGLKRASKSLEATLVARSVSTSVEPLVCFTEAMLGAAVTNRSVRFVTVSDLVSDIARHSATVERARAQRAARVLGMQIEGDERRHFAVG
jgi:hypothetical protein